MCEKRTNGAECIQRYKNINLNKIQRSNEWVAQDKVSRKEKWFIMMVIKTKGKQIMVV